MEKNNLSSLKIDRSKENYQGRKGKKTLVWIIIAVLIITAAIIFGTGNLFSSAIEVKLTAATLQSPSQSDAVLTASGYVVAQRKAAVASKGTGRLVYLGVVEGDKVKKDEVIARLEDNDIQAQLAETKANLQLNEAQLKEAKNNYDRQKALLKTGGISETDYEIAETNYKKVLASIELAKAQVQASEVALENTVIRAPFDGTVLTKNADVGEIVAPLAAGVNSRAAVVTIADMSSLQVEADVSESNIQKVTNNQACEITLDAYPAHHYAGYVAKIVPTADRTKATVMVKVGFKHYDSRVLPEMSAKVLFLKKEKGQNESNEKAMLVLPQSAVEAKEGNQFVFKVKDNKAYKVPVTTGKTFSDFVEITSGLENGDQVIDNVTDQIKNGTEVTVK
ncbi:MAG: efflux RND transporter periplasmic adaptor subunit [Ignavibacteriaceae bacterium]